MHRTVYSGYDFDVDVKAILDAIDSRKCKIECFESASLKF